MDMHVTKDRTQEIKNELTELNTTLKMTVQKAIRVGQLLSEQKEFVGHGNFVKWIENNLDIDDNTVYRYIKLYSYADKIPILGNLQDAYKQIETIEAQAKMTAEENQRKMIAEYRKTGKKPEGWTRQLDYIIKKDAEAEQNYKERKEKELKERDERAKEYKNKSTGLFSEAFKTVADGILAKAQAVEDWKDKIRLSDSGKKNAFADAILEYLDTLPNDSRRIEACMDIIKICRNIAVKLQKVSN